MRIVVDMQFANTGSAKRGIGRYALGLLEAVYEQKGEHEIIFAFADFGCVNHDVMNLIRKFVNSSDIVAWQGVGPTALRDAQNLWRWDVSCVLRHAFIASLFPDAVLVPSLMEGLQDDVAIDVAALAGDPVTAVILYDLIPFHHPDTYLRTAQSRNWYLRQVESLKKADVLLAISEHARLDALSTLGLTADRVKTILAGIDEKFHVLAEGNASETICAKFRIQRPFLLTAGGVEHRKNVERLVAAIGLLPDALKNSFQLVVLGCNDTFSQNLVPNVWAKQYGVDPASIIPVSHVNDDDLVSLYNSCELFVFPSFFEGFGFPPLEALACGAPVLSANATSLPEVVQRDDLLFDPFDSKAMALRIAEVLGDQDFRREFKVWGPKHTSQFTWARSAEITLRSIEIAVGDRLMSSPSIDARQATRNALQRIAKLDVGSQGVTEYDLFRIAEALSQNEGNARRFKKSINLKSVLNWQVEGPFDSSYSLAIVNREFARALSQCGHRIVLRSTEGFGDFEPNPDYLARHPDVQTMAAADPLTASNHPYIVSRNLYPPRVADMQGAVNLLHCYGWEETGFPQEWIDNFNMTLDGISCMSSHVQRVMVNHGVTCRLSVSSLGTDHWDRIIPDKGWMLNTDKSYRFVHVSSCFPRKGITELLDAYGIAFSDEDDVILIIKTFPNPHNEIHRWIEDARRDKPNYPAVMVIEDDLTDEQMKALLTQSHAAVFPSKAEGFGFPIAEAMLSGLPVITTRWSGQVDFCDNETTWLVDYDFERAQSHFKLYASAWARPRVGDLSKRLAEVYRAKPEQLKVKIEAAQSRLRAHFKWSDVAKRSEEFVRSCAKDGRIELPCVVWVSTWNTKCGIASYSASMLNDFGLDQFMGAPDNQEIIGVDGHNVDRVWSVGDSDDLSRLEEAIMCRSADIVVIQFNYGLFNLRALARLIQRLAALGRRVVITLHSTVDPDHLPHKRLEDMRAALLMCARVVVHSIDDMNRLKSMGVIDNVMLFPLGVPDYEPRVSLRGNKRGNFVLGSYGFALPHKGILELIEAVAVLVAKGLRVELKLMNAEYPAPQSKALIDEAKDLITRRRLGSLVHLDTRYLTDAESMDALSECDLLLFPYQQTGESASAAVRHGLATGRPVAVSPLPIFNDLTSAAFVLPGTSIDKIADGIESIRSHLRADSPLAKSIAEEADNWRSQHRYSVLSKRMKNMLIALFNLKE